MVQKLQLLGRSIHPLAVHNQFVGIQIHYQLIEGQLLLRARPLFSGPAKHSMDAGQNLLHLKGLGNIVVRSHFQTGNLVLQLSLGCEHDNRRLGGFPDFPAHCPAVHPGQHDVQQHQVRLELAKLLYPHQAVSGQLTLHLLLLQIDAQQVSDILVVLHDQNLDRHKRHPFIVM